MENFRILKLCLVYEAAETLSKCRNRKSERLGREPFIYINIAEGHFSAVFSCAPLLQEANGMTWECSRFAFLDILSENWLHNTDCIGYTNMNRNLIVMA